MMVSIRPGFYTVRPKTASACVRMAPDCHKRPGKALIWGSVFYFCLKHKFTL